MRLQGVTQNSTAQDTNPLCGTIPNVFDIISAVGKQRVTLIFLSLAAPAIT